MALNRMRERVGYRFRNRSPSIDRNLANEPPDKPDEYKGLLYGFNEFLKENITKMTGARPVRMYKGLTFRCDDSRRECNYTLNVKSMVADGSCLFESMLFLLNKERSRKNRLELRQEIVSHYHSQTGIRDDALLSEHAYMPDEYIKSFCDLYQRNVVLFSLYNDGSVEVTLFLNRSIPEQEFSVDFLVLTQNPGHYTSISKVKGFKQSPEFLEYLLSKPTGVIRGPLRPLREIIGIPPARFNDKIKMVLLCENMEELHQLFRPRREVRGLAPLLPLEQLEQSAPVWPNAPPVWVSHAATPRGSRSRRSRSRSRSGSVSSDIAEYSSAIGKSLINATPRSSRGSRHSPGSSLSSIERAQIAAAMAESEDEEKRIRGLRHLAAARSVESDVKEQIARMYLEAAPGLNNISPRTKAQIDALEGRRNPLSLAPNVENDVKEQIGRMHLASAENVSPRTKALLYPAHVNSFQGINRGSLNRSPRRRTIKKFRMGSIPKHIGRLFGFTKKKR
jgi:hypothetical protein